MHTIDRTTPPAYKQVEKIEYIKANRKSLSNGTPLYTINTGKEDFVKLDVVFNAGSRYQKAPLIARFTNAMLAEGTKSMGSEAISERLDYFGAYLEHSTSADFAELTLITPNKYFRETLAIFREVLQEPAFPAREFEIMMRNEKQSYLVRSQRVDFICRKGFVKELLNGHPYGQFAELEDYENLQLKELESFYKTYYQASNSKIIISGKVKNEHTNLLDKQLGQQRSTSISRQPMPELKQNQPAKQYIEKPDAVQSSLRIGKVMFNKLHPDYQYMQLLTTLLGGYFGSRLMTNVREEKGYTYGIFSMVNPLQLGGYFVIKADVGKDVDRLAANEIYKEIRRLREEPVSEEEINLVTNYFRGQLMRLFDGVFSLPASLRGLIDYGLDYDYYDRYFTTLNSFNAEKVQELANKYLQEDSLIEIIAGNNKANNM